VYIRIAKYVLQKGQKRDTGRYHIASMTWERENERKWERKRKEVGK
jgi:hypothetical protein